MNPRANSLLCLFVCNNITVKKVVSDFKIKMAAAPNVEKTEDLSFIFLKIHIYCDHVNNLSRFSLTKANSYKI